MKFFKDKKLEVDVYTSEIKLIENHIASILRRLNKLEELKADTIPYKDLHQVVKNVLAQPMRELSNEEIMEIYNDQANRDFQLRSDPFKFARAILQKASEK